MRPQSRTGVSVPRPPSDNINWMLEKMGGAGKQGAKKRAQKKEVLYFTSS